MTTTAGASHLHIPALSLSYTVVRVISVRCGYKFSGAKGRDPRYNTPFQQLLPLLFGATQLLLEVVLLQLYSLN